ncbi:MAG TPA: class I SAM-dependent methyltransferase [Polyangiaceae bacterium]|nr:class I SAM-dependent methyltransferase [Polyangiaceae bacterium]
MSGAQAKEFPLDLARTAYSYVERPNPAIQALLARHVTARVPRARVLDVGCGCGANAQALGERAPGVEVVGIEPNPRAAELARRACFQVFQGTLDDWAHANEHAAPFDAIVLSDVLEHVADPISFVRQIAALPAVRRALWIVSVPNYAVWYNRLRTMFGRQEYAWSGLWDRTHLRFFTRRTARELLEYCGLTIVDSSCTPSIVQSAAPLLRKAFDKDVRQGEHLALAESGPYKVYRDVVEPVESRVCELWPELLGFQVVFAARRLADVA